MEKPVYYDKKKAPDYFISSKIRVTQASGKGLGVYAVDEIDENEVVECCPTLLVTYDKKLRWNWVKRFYKASVVTVFDDYLWWWRAKKNLLLLGYGNLYNHSDEFNAKAYKLKDRKALFVAKRKIHSGEEITINYGMTPLWFDVAQDRQLGKNENEDS